MVVGCMTRHELVVEPDEGRCHMYGVTGEDISRAIAAEPKAKDVKALGRVVLKVLPDGRSCACGTWRRCGIAK